MADERDFNGLEPENGPVDDRSASEADDLADGAFGRGPAADPSSDAPAAGGPAPEGVTEEPTADRRGGREEPAEPPTDWNYSSSGSDDAGGPDGSGRRRKGGGEKGGAAHGGGRKRNRGVTIAIVAVLVVAVVGIVAAVVELTSCDHVWVEATCTEPATCTKCGKTDGEALGHDWQEATCSEPETCSRCGETEGEALGHEWEDATCTEPETCSRCGETQGDPLGHTVEEWTVTLEPTSAVEGEQTGTCTVCGEEVTEAIATTDDHTEGEWSFTYEGGTGKKVLLCAECGEVLETEDATVYNEGEYVVGEDLPAGEYKLYADISSEFEASVVVFADSSSTSVADQLIIATFDDCYYITVDDGQYLWVSDAVIVPVDEAEPTSDVAGSGMYKVGYDIEPGEYRFTGRTDADYSSVYVWNSSDVDDTNSSVYGELLVEGESCTCTLSEGQYLDLHGVEIEPVS